MFNTAVHYTEAGQLYTILRLDSEKKRGNETRKITKKYKLCYELSNAYSCTVCAQSVL